jgi:hypothetical protein
MVGQLLHQFHQFAGRSSDPVNTGHNEHIIFTNEVERGFSHDQFLRRFVGVYEELFATSSAQDAFLILGPATFNIGRVEPNGWHRPTITNQHSHLPSSRHSASIAALQQQPNALIIILS